MVPPHILQPPRHHATTRLLAGFLGRGVWFPFSLLGFAGKAEITAVNLSSGSFCSTRNKSGGIRAEWNPKHSSNTQQHTKATVPSPLLPHPVRLPLTVDLMAKLTCLSLWHPVSDKWRFFSFFFLWGNERRMWGSADEDVRFRLVCSVISLPCYY